MDEFSPEMQDDIGKWWDKYREEHDVPDNIVLTIIDTKNTIERTLMDVIEMIVSEVARHRKYEGKSALEPKEDDKEDERDRPTG